MNKAMTIPNARFHFGQPVCVRWHEPELGVTEAVITGINYDPNRPHAGVQYTITEHETMQTDGIDESMLSAR